MSRSGGAGMPPSPHNSSRGLSLRPPLNPFPPSSVRNSEGGASPLAPTSPLPPLAPSSLARDPSGATPQSPASHVMRRPPLQRPPIPPSPSANVLTPSVMQHLTESAFNYPHYSSSLGSTTTPLATSPPMGMSNAVSASIGPNISTSLSSPGPSSSSGSNSSSGVSGANTSPMEGNSRTLPFNAASASTSSSLSTTPSNPITQLHMNRYYGGGVSFGIGGVGSGNGSSSGIGTYGGSLSVPYSTSNVIPTDFYSVIAGQSASTSLSTLTGPPNKTPTPANNGAFNNTNSSNNTSSGVSLGGSNVGGGYNSGMSNLPGMSARSNQVNITRSIFNKAEQLLSNDTKDPGTSYSANGMGGLSSMGMAAAYSNASYLPNAGLTARRSRASTNLMALNLGRPSIGTANSGNGSGPLPPIPHGDPILRSGSRAAMTASPSLGTRQLLPPGLVGQYTTGNSVGGGGSSGGGSGGVPKVRASNSLLLPNDQDLTSDPSGGRRRGTGESWGKRETPVASEGKDSIVRGEGGSTGVDQSDATEGKDATLNEGFAMDDETARLSGSLLEGDRQGDEDDDLGEIGVGDDGYYDDYHDLSGHNRVQFETDGMVCLDHILLCLLVSIYLSMF